MAARTRPVVVDVAGLGPLFEARDWEAATVVVLPATGVLPHPGVLLAFVGADAIVGPLVLVGPGRTAWAMRRLMAAVGADAAVANTDMQAARASLSALQEHFFLGSVTILHMSQDAAGAAPTHEQGRLAQQRQQAELLREVLSLSAAAAETRAELTGLGAELRGMRQELREDARWMLCLALISASEGGVAIICAIIALVLAGITMNRTT